MPDVEKVIKGLEEVQHYIKVENLPAHTLKAKLVIDDALALLKAMKPMVMTWEEAQASVNEGPFIIIEVRDSTGSEVDFGVLVGDYYEMSEGSVLTVADFWMMRDDYGKRFRLWTSRPTDEQMEKVKWE